MRTRDPQAPTRLGFRGVPTWEHDPDWVRPGRFTPPTARRGWRCAPRVTTSCSTPPSSARSTSTSTACATDSARSAAGDGLGLLFHDTTNGRCLGALAHRHDVGAGPRRQRRRRLQPRGQPSLRLHGLRHVPGARHGQPHRRPRHGRGEAAGMRFCHLHAARHEPRPGHRGRPHPDAGLRARRAPGRVGRGARLRRVRGGGAARPALRLVLAARRPRARSRRARPHPTHDDRDGALAPRPGPRRRGLRDARPPERRAARRRHRQGQRPRPERPLRLRPRGPVGAQRREVRAVPAAVARGARDVVGTRSGPRSSTRRPSRGRSSSPSPSGTARRARPSRPSSPRAGATRSSPPTASTPWRPTPPSCGTTASGGRCTATTRPTRSSVPDSSGSSSPTRHRRRCASTSRRSRRSGARRVPCTTACPSRRWRSTPATAPRSSARRPRSSTRSGATGEAFGHELSGVSLDVPGLPESVTRRSVERFFADVAPVVRREHPSRQEFRHALNA